MINCSVVLSRMYINLRKADFKNDAQKKSYSPTYNYTRLDTRYITYTVIILLPRVRPSLIVDKRRFAAIAVRSTWKTRAFSASGFRDQERNEMYRKRKKKLNKNPTPIPRYEIMSEKKKERRK